MAMLKNNTPTRQFRFLAPMMSAFLSGTGSIFEMKKTGISAGAAAPARRCQARCRWQLPGFIPHQDVAGEGQFTAGKST
jgi:hypothetical protein